jgi:hypothetical protein
MMLVITRKGNKEGKTLLTNKLTPSNAELIQSFGVNTICTIISEQIIVTNKLLSNDFRRIYNNITIKISIKKKNRLNKISPFSSVCISIFNLTVEILQ